jgi:hypothetical protein
MDSPTVRERYKAAGYMVRSAHAFGIGRACNRRRLAVAVFYSDPTWIANSAHKIGRWLAREDVDVDIIVILSAMPIEQ